MIDLSAINALPPAVQQRLFEGPALASPDGISQFSNPPNWNSLGYGVAITGIVTVGVLVSVQIYSRLRYHRKFGLEDYITISALISFATFMAFVLRIVVSPGIFVHQWDIQLKNMPDLLYNITATAIAYCPVVAFLKAGILLHWTKLFVPTGYRNGFWWACHITLWVNVVFYTICMFLQIFACSPRHKLWTPWAPGKCADVAMVYIIPACINVVFDFIILLIPQMVIWKLHASTAKKIGISALFAVGILATIAAGFRIRSTITFTEVEDVSYAVTELGLWAVAEMVAGFFALCLPHIPILFKHSPWIQKAISAIRSFSGQSSSRTGGSEPESAGRAGFGTFRKARRNPDASLFTDTHLSNRSFIPLSDVSASKNRSAV
ncbi:unnamed protein product [Periconia digitata]|uniref:Rhodopsin domain-containing protein n=1 Tax=Periconia digitata TaxID=1303443 RepID=A0A9W4UTG9_9PLEO|nr:unnamed protein product [Periconia digitata]